MKLNSTSFSVGVLAGLVSALMSASVFVHPGIAMLLYFFIPFPIFMAGLGWGNLASAVAIGVALTAIAYVAMPMTAFLVALTCLIPAAVGAHLAGLARPAEECGGPKNTLLWYPLSNILFCLTLIVSVNFIIIGIIIGFNADLAREIVNAIMESFAQADPNFATNNAIHENLARFLIKALPAIQPATCLIILITNFYMALYITAFMNRLRRPQDDWPLTLRMPRIGLMIFAVSLALTFLDGGPGQAAVATVGSLSAGFMLCGFAILHFRTRSASWRLFVLWFAYLAVLLFAFLLFFFLIAGLFDTSRKVSVSHRTKS